MADELPPTDATTTPPPRRKAGRPRTKGLRIVKPPSLPKIRTYGVSPQEALFVREYLIDLNASEAARRAGYSEGASARVTGHHLLKKPNVAAAIQDALIERMQRVEAKADDVLRELMALAFSDVRGIAEWTDTTVTLRSSDKISAKDAAAIASISQGKDGVQLKLHDKAGPLGLLMRHLNLLPTTKIQAGGAELEINGDNTVVIYLPDNGRDKPQPVVIDAQPVGANGANGHHE